MLLDETIYCCLRLGCIAYNVDGDEEVTRVGDLPDSSEERDRFIFFRGHRYALRERDSTAAHETVSRDDRERHNGRD